MSNVTTKAPSDVLLTKPLTGEDQLVSIAQQIEGMKDDRDGVYSQISEVQNNKSFDDFKLGGLLTVAQEQKWYKDDGYSKFREFLEAQFPTIEYRKANYLMNMYVALIEAEVEWEDEVVTAGGRY